MLYCEYPPDRSLSGRVQHLNADDEIFRLYGRMATLKLSDKLSKSAISSCKIELPVKHITMPSEYGEREPEDKRRRGRVCRRLRKSAEAIPSYLHRFTLCSHRYEELQRACKGASYERRGESSPFLHSKLSSVSYLRLVHAFSQSASSSSGLLFTSTNTAPLLRLHHAPDLWYYVEHSPERTPSVIGSSCANPLQSPVS